MCVCTLLVSIYSTYYIAPQLQSRQRGNSDPCSFVVLHYASRSRYIRYHSCMWFPSVHQALCPSCAVRIDACIMYVYVCTNDFPGWKCVLYSLTAASRLALKDGYFTDLPLLIHIVAPIYISLRSGTTVRENSSYTVCR